MHSNFSACCILLFYDNAVSIGAQRKGWLRRLFLGSNPWYFDFWVFDHTKSTAHFHFCFCLKYFSRYLVNDLSIFLSVLKINWIEKFLRGGWSGFGMVPVGINPTSIGILNGHPTEIPPDKMLGGVVQNCRKITKNNQNHHKSPPTPTNQPICTTNMIFSHYMHQL